MLPPLILELMVWNWNLLSFLVEARPGRPNPYFSIMIRAFGAPCFSLTFWRKDIPGEIGVRGRSTRRLFPTTLALPTSALTRKRPQTSVFLSSRVMSDGSTWTKVRGRNRLKSKKDTEYQVVRTGIDRKCLKASVLYPSEQPRCDVIEPCFGDREQRSRGFAEKRWKRRSPLGHRGWREKASAKRYRWPLFILLCALFSDAHFLSSGRSTVGTSRRGSTENEKAKKNKQLFMFPWTKQCLKKKVPYDL